MWLIIIREITFFKKLELDLQGLLLLSGARDKKKAPLG
jgi:hypothetical protein